MISNPKNVIQLAHIYFDENVRQFRKKGSTTFWKQRVRQFGHYSLDQTREVALVTLFCPDSY